MVGVAGVSEGPVIGGVVGMVDEVVVLGDCGSGSVVADCGTLDEVDVGRSVVVVVVVVVDVVAGTRTAGTSSVGGTGSGRTLR